MKKNSNKSIILKAASAFSAFILCTTLNAQSNVFDDIIATSPNHIYLAAALEQESLHTVLQDSESIFTVFAPNDNAFESLAMALGTDIAGLLELPNLADILTYHVLDSEVPASAVTNGAIVQPLSMSNTLKLTVTSDADVFVNQAPVSMTDLMSDNGIVHVIDQVVLPSETVADIAIDNGFTSLTAAVVAAELLPALTNPLASLTVFAPNNDAFESLANELGTDIPGLLELPNLADILYYHVIDEAIGSSDLIDGPLTTLNGSDLEVSTSGEVLINGASLSLVDLMADNGIVHVVNDVLVQSPTSVQGVDKVEISVYPNPSTSYIKVKTDESFESLSIVDLKGNIIGVFSLRNGMTMIDTTPYGTGTYLLQFSGDQAQSTRPFQIISSY